MTELTCAEFRQMSAELALGVADARERAAALAHLERCRACRQEMGQFSDVADGLAALAPPAEPPAGFESRVLDALSQADRPVPRRLPVRRAVVWLAAAAALIVVVGGVGWVLGNQNHQPTQAAGRVVVAKLTGSRGAVGQVVIDSGPDPWMSMAVAIPGGRTTVRCELRTVSGGMTTVGTFTVWKGYGYWAAPIPVIGSTVDGAQVVDMQGHVLASASLSPTRFVDAAKD
jgi:hypothetical protein